VSEYEAFPLIFPVSSSLAGNVGCIFASRLSTQFHGKRDTEMESLMKSRENLIVMGTLFAISLPIHLAFLGFVHLLGTFKFGVVFLFSYLIMGALSVNSTVNYIH
jgi:cation transporter-like permease